jgi:hypothetical protein
MRKANEHRERQHAHDYLVEGISVLEDVIADKGKITPYPFHILGSQALIWSREDRSLLGVAKREFLGDVLEQVKKGCEYHSGISSFKNYEWQLRRRFSIP